MFKNILAILMVATVLLSSIAVVDAISYGRGKGSSQAAQIAPVAAAEEDEETTSGKSLREMRKDKLQDHAEKIRDNCKVEDSPECLRVVDGVGTSLDQLIRNIRDMHIRARDQLNTIDSAEKDAKITMVDERIAQLDALADELKDATTLDEVRAIKKRFHDLWKDQHKALVVTRSVAWDGRVSAALEKVERVVMRLQALAERIKQTDVKSDIEILEQIDVALAKIKARVATVNEALENGNREAVKTGLKELRELLKEVRQHFKNLKHDDKDYDKEHDAAIRDSIRKDSQAVEPVPALAA